MTGQAPPGFHTVVSVRVRVEKSQRVYDYSWTTPMALHRAIHKAPKWARQAMTAAGVRGRSRISALRVEAQYEPGEFTKDE